MNQERVDYDIDEHIKMSTQLELPAEVEAGMRRQLEDFRQRLKARQPGRLEALWNSFCYALSTPRVRMLAVSCSILLLAMAALWVATSSTVDSGKMYAATVQKFKLDQALAYTIVLNEQPYVAVDFSWQPPGYERVSTSWGLEIRVDHLKEKKMLLLHYLKKYAFETYPDTGLQNEPSLREYLKSLAPQAEKYLGEKVTEGRSLLGFRSKESDLADPSKYNVLDVWIDAQTGEPHHVDITNYEEGKPVHLMHIANIHLGISQPATHYDLTPPEGYTPLDSADLKTEAGPEAQLPELHAVIKEMPAMTAVVMPMHGSYVQHEMGIAKVEAYLEQSGVPPTGAPFGRYFNTAGTVPEDQLSWEVGYPVSSQRAVNLPFELRTIPKAVMASAMVKGPHGEDETGRWLAFLKSIAGQGYVPAGTAMEIWTEAPDPTDKQGQLTEMRIPVVSAH
ncbi:MAG TPA: GyrI-like domain-containing protein [Terriglobia bacterium]|nr:GyrI-like domain-containing protein [Terriglobia bacterium]